MKNGLDRLIELYNDETRAKEVFYILKNAHDSNPKTDTRTEHIDEAISYINGLNDYLNQHINKYYTKAQPVQLEFKFPEYDNYKK